ncbi:MAG: hypothetical protein GY769_07335 [bacterium]|nr:hypothetical protein [bacterium]
MSRLEETGVEGKRARWPGVVGVVGIIVAVLMFVDQVDDLLALLVLSPETWSRWLGPKQAEIVVRLMPPVGWVAVAAVIGAALAVLLFIGSMRIHRHMRSGVELCRRWSQVTIAWAVIQITAAISWLQRNADFISDLANGEWQGAAAFGVVVALGVMLAFPVFLLVWLSRPVVRREYATWPTA